MEKLKRDFVVLGGGPGGYTAAFRAADLGKSVTIIEKEAVLGGVCLNVGCIPSKTLLHISDTLLDAKELSQAGVNFAEPTIELEKLAKHKEQVISKLTDGLDQLCKARKIERITATGSFINDSTLLVKGENIEAEITFNELVIAVGSRPIQIGNIPYEDNRIWDSTTALALKEVPKRIVVIGGGIIGLELSAIYNSLGSEITIVELADSIIPGVDRDLKQPLLKEIQKRYKAIYTSTEVTKVEALKEKLIVHLKEKDKESTIEADVVLVAVGRKVNSDKIELQNTSIKTDERNFIEVDEQMRTSKANVFAIGDVTGNPMLAHKAVHQAKVAAESAAGKKAAFTALSIPSVAYTRPEIAWVGLTEQQAKEKNIKFRKGSFPWQASGRAMSAIADSGISKVLFDDETGRLIGAGITGKNAGELIGEATLALEMGSDAYDISLTIHAHPTLSETFAVAAELSEGIATDLTNR
jgi:dihydrolipoamide dehydrogenase